MGTNNSLKKGKRYLCPYCNFRGYRSELIEHVDEEHEDLIPKDYTAARVVYNHINKKDHGSCMICHKETKWDESKQRYDSLCGKPKCKEEYVKVVRSRMVKKYGTYNLLTDAEFQKKMLENRSISGKYKFADGGSVGYVGSYEKKFLEFMDVFLHIKSYDIMSPGPSIPYKYNGKEHVWITDFLYEPYNLVFDIKDGGDNPNTRDMKEYRAKQIAKEKAIADYGDYNYIRLTDNKFDQLILMMIELKDKVEDDKPLIRINDSYIEELSSRDIAAYAINSLPKYKLYRVTYNGIGIYEALKKSMDNEAWEKFLKSSVAKWLSKSSNDIYANKSHGFKYTSYISYFTKDGYEKFKSSVLPVISKYLDKNKIKTTTSNYNKFEKNYNIVYNDKYQVIFGKLENSNESYVEEESRIPDDQLPKYIYHISSVNHNGDVFEPRKYDNDNVKNGMERYVSRVCFADSIQGCLYSIFPNGAFDADFYVHVPAHNVKVYATTKDDIYDSEITHELWVKEPVEMKCIGKIHVSGVSDKGTKIIDIESDKVPYNKKKYHKCIWKWAEKYDKDEALFESYK